MKHTCIICGNRFNLSKTETDLINNGEISPLDVNICDECADVAMEQAEAGEIKFFEYEY